jgi:hypothetical protein
MPEKDDPFNADMQRRAQLEAAEARRREIEKAYAETGQLPLPPGMVAGTWGPIASKEKETEDLAAFSSKRKPKKDQSRVPSGWDQTRQKVAAAIDAPIQSAGSTIDYYAGPHAQKTFGRIAQAGDIAASMTPILGDMRDMTTSMVDAVDDFMAGDYGSAAMNVGLGGATLLPGMFIGPAARNFPHDKAQEAIDMLRRDASPEAIRRKTGIIFDSAGIPRLEIDDSTSGLTPKGEKFARGGAIDPRSPMMPLDQAYDHPELYDNYPQLRGYMTRFADDGGPAGAFHPAYGGKGAHLEAYGQLDAAPTGTYNGPRNQRQVALHEMQHAVSDIEGSSMGSMPESVPKEVRDAFPDKTNYQLYRRAGDEVLANTTALRADLDPEMRDIVSPYYGVDNPNKDDLWNSVYKDQQEEFPRSEQWSERLASGSGWDDPRGARTRSRPAFDPADPTARRPDYLWGGPSGGYGGASREPVMGSVPDPATPVAPNGPRRRRAISGLGDFPNTAPEYIASATAQNGGNSVNIPTGGEPVDGLMMGMYRNDDPRNMVVTGQMSPQDAEAFFKTNKKALQGEDKYFGTWFSPDDGKTYLDVSRRFEPDQVRKATKFGERTGQIAGFNRGTFETFPVGNWDEFVQGDEFAGRMDEMAKYGGQFLDQYPTRQWWDMMGTSIEDTYGPNTSYMAGTTAATAPNAQPRENLQTSSEYMRRIIKGEPMVQPDWRVGDSGGPPMSRTVGTKIGMEDGRKGNLERAGRGEPLGGPKVESERRAMLGDPDAVVLDRWHARLGEKPQAGVFTEVEEGTISPENYPLLERVFQEEARKQGMTPRDFSADVWTGVRERVRNTGDLYGTPYKASAVRGESKAYADVWTDLLKEKAGFLGISVDEMKARLRSGDANLLSALPAIPGGMAILNALGYGSPEQGEPGL